ncbi:tyrosine-type recombinase/integrase [Brevibacillus sp. NRS-1366]|uniref:tyrosine-type recombinase/integrase n=1 Tax=Brevibacillus sp. NRS-1366 TaxID=3233899 RepID=UPI003D1A679B
MRDEVITRLLFETGARASEVIELTFDDYRMRANQTEARAPNKGSHKKRTKYIRFSQETLKLLIRYVNSERKSYTKQNLGFEDVPDTEPIFVTTHGRPFNYPAYYAQWLKVIRNAGLKLNPHKARHWYVTTMMRSIFETSKDDAEIVRKKKELIHYMRWRDESTIEVYEHYFNEMEFGEIQNAIHDNMRLKEKEYTTKKCSAARKKIKVSPKSESAETVDDEKWLMELMEGIAQ